ncbi:Gfo/Idh/MocA family oxidoreductase [Isosphaeraceae bacterium EP7]
MIRLGMIDFDTSHVVEFTKRINHIDIAEDQWVEGAKVVAGVPGVSLIMPERVPGYTAAMKKYGIEILDDPAQLFGKIDAVMIEANDGSVHRERAMPFIERGIPVFVDKPFACSVDDARTMLRAAMEKHVPLMSCSSLRYAAGLADARAGKGPAGDLLGAFTYGPAPLHPRNPGLFHYGIHPVELLFTLMGTGCTKVNCTFTEGAEVATGVWSDGRVAGIRGIRAGKQDYGFTMFGAKGVVTQGIDTKYGYRDMLKAVITMFETKESPIDPRETLEIVAFIEAAKASADAGGASIPLKAGL